MATGHHVTFMTASASQPSTDITTQCSIVVYTGPHQSFITKVFADKLQLKEDGSQKLFMLGLKGYSCWVLKVIHVGSQRLFMLTLGSGGPTEQTSFPVIKL